MITDTAPSRARAGGRSARRAIRTAPKFDMLPGLTRALPVCEVMDGAQVERIDAASMDILENVGVQFRDPIALEDWKRAGARVAGEMVYLDRGLVRELIATIPETFTYHARDPQKNVRLGGRHSVFVPMTGAPYLRDLDDMRRNPTLADLEMFHKLSHMMPALHSSAHHIVEPYDHPISQRHLRITYSSMKHSDKMFMGMTTSPKNAEDVMEMCAILFGADFLEEHPVTTGNCNGNSPLVWDETMLGAMRAFCRRNQPVLCSPFVLGGANTPASVPATVAQLNAEALSALAYTQVIRRGCPAIYGHYLSTVSMKSGAPMAGTPEISLMNFMIGQMARFYCVPWRTSNTLGGAKTFDAQAGYESATTLSAVIHAGANYIWHSAGWNEAGMHCSVAKFVVDAEQCAMAHRMASGPQWDDFDEALAAIPDVGPGGHYLGHPHTQENFQTAFFMPELFDNNSIEQWVADGSREITERALIHARRLLDAYEESRLDPGVNEALLDYIARREREIPAADALNQEY
ncbi:trimethylamine---corrinoid protein Co-methyltransferase [Roseovarius azorensis]|uniref:Methyltransferase n=1 Tax=Roseovarius azorensis TaxID=1287727 RepID=A0A1H7NDD4_9RHOB|nr:trimethylamine methyltransferase family protein [Roseovarius azorensis]SEL20985.1 trimethylamine---corrinoid protein Co-methyltransferase [Roseovarius azorensis]